MGLAPRWVNLAYFLLLMFLISYGLLLVLRGYLTTLIAERLRRSRTRPSSTG